MPSAGINLTQITHIPYKFLLQLFYPYKIQNELLSSIYSKNYQIFLRISLILHSIKRTDYSAGTFYIFLSGYHNSAKQNFIKKIHIQNLEKDGVKRGKVQVKSMGVHKKIIYEIFSHRPYYDELKTKN